MEQIVEILESLNGQLGEAASGDAVVGSPIKLGPVTVYPISRISIALGGGGGEGEELSKEGQKKGGSESGMGGGVGGGAKARPVAVLVISQDGVTVLPIPDKKGKLDRIIDRIPEFVERLRPIVEAKS